MIQKMAINKNVLKEEINDNTKALNVNSTKFLHFQLETRYTLQKNIQSNIQIIKILENKKDFYDECLKNIINPIEIKSKFSIISEDCDQLHQILQNILNELETLNDFPEMKKNLMFSLCLNEKIRVIFKNSVLINHFAHSFSNEVRSIDPIRMKETVKYLI